MILPHTKKQEYSYVHLLTLFKYCLIMPPLNTSKDRWKKWKFCQISRQLKSLSTTVATTTPSGAIRDSHYWHPDVSPVAPRCLFPKTVYCVLQKKLKKCVGLLNGLLIVAGLCHAKNLHKRSGIALFKSIRI